MARYTAYDEDGTAWFVGIIAALALSAIAYLVFFSAPSTIAAPLAGSTLRMNAPSWSGSAVHIGNGYIITAGHVADGQKSLEVTMDNGATITGEVLWVNTPTDGYDVALVYAPGILAEAANLNCNAVKIGDAIRIEGNPAPLNFQTSWGHVSGFVTPNGWGPWDSLVALNAAAAPGVSGGPVYNANGEVVGILVSGLMTNTGFMGYSFMVPSTTICTLLART